VERKCGTCVHMRVRPDEVALAQHAKPMAYCGPGRYCHGGPVRGHCDALRRQVESTDPPCREGLYEPGGPSVRIAGSQAKDKVGYVDLDSLTDDLLQTLTSNGNILVFAVTGALALGSQLVSDWKWDSRRAPDLPSVVDQEGIRYYYRLLDGGRRAAIYLPSGRVVERRVTAAASRNPKQLEDEIYTIVLDNYQSLG